MNYFNRQNTLLLIATSALYAWATAVLAQPAAQLTPFEGSPPGSLNPAWQLSGLPNNKFPLTRFEMTEVQGEAVLQVRTDKSYGVLSHTWQGSAATELAWRWQLAQALPQTDITTKAGDDAAIKVCVMFDQPVTDIPFFQRAALLLARSATRQNLPSATLCYLWDSRYPAGKQGANPYSARVRYIVLNGLETPVGQWVNQRRRVADDFASLFGTESRVMPPVTAIAVGADSDNTGGTSLAYLTRLQWMN